MRRLGIDVEKRLDALHLRIRLEVGTEIMVLFGPSGAGKTTTLNAVAGLVAPDAGEIVLDGTPLFRRRRPGAPVDLAARKRRIGYVFQHYALFPHLTALENVAYPLWRQADARRRARALLERVRLGHLGARYPHELSGGQQQRVALARALAMEPPVLLLDEPFSALDAAMRELLQRDLAALQQELGLIVLYVTHRLEDAFAIGHRLAVIREGEVEQVGPIEEVCRRPATPGVAEAIGIRNLLRARVVRATPEELRLDWEGLELSAPPQGIEDGAPVTAYIRPEEIKILYPDRPLTRAVEHNLVEGRIVEIAASASFRDLRVELPNGRTVEVRFPTFSYTPLRLAPGEAIRLSLRRAAIVTIPEPLVAAER